MAFFLQYETYIKKLLASSSFLGLEKEISRYAAGAAGKVKGSSGILVDVSKSSADLSMLRLSINKEISSGSTW